MLGENEANIDPLKFTWLGSMNRDASLAMSWYTSKVKTFEDLKQHELLVPGTGAGADSEILPLAFNRLAGTRFKIIEGYRDTSVAALAMERGELDGLAYWSWSSIMSIHPDWVRDKKVNLLFQTGVDPIPGIARCAAHPQSGRQSHGPGVRSRSCLRARSWGVRSSPLLTCRPTALPRCARPSRRRCAIPAFLEDATARPA